MKSFAFANIDELRHALDTKQISREELAAYCYARFATYDKQLGSMLELFDKNSVLRSSAPSGALAGIPGVIKDNIAQQGRKLTCGSLILQGFVAPYDATATQRLKQAGALLLGRANCDEFAMGGSNEYSAYFKAHNPWDTTRIPGGSSGGSIVAVAAGLVPWALGTETGGSVRLPAGFCGIVGLKPTYGLISRYGVVAYASSFDQVGIATRSVKDNAQVLSVIAGADAHDATTKPVAQKDYTQTLDGKLPEGFTIGVLENMVYAQGMNPAVQERIESAIKEFEKLGARIKKITIPVLDYSAAVYFILSRAEAASNLARFDGVRYGLRASDASDLQDMYMRTRHDGFGREVRARILIGNYVLSAGYSRQFYANAKKVQRMMAAEVAKVFKDVDVLLAPTQAAPAYTIGACDNDPLMLDLMDFFTCFANIIGIPGLALPCGFVDELPVGFQLFGPALSEELLFKVGHAYEQVTPWHTMHPKAYVE